MNRVKTSMILKSNGKELATDVDFACSLLTQIKGLMFSKRIPENYALVFAMKRMQKVSLHMLFVNFPIDAIFLDENKRVIQKSSLKAWIEPVHAGKKQNTLLKLPTEKQKKWELKSR
ncbi:MAG: DUF192 domain-containing protein [Methanolobus sp.]